MSIQSLLLSPAFLSLVLGIAVTLATIPGGLLASLLNAVLAHFKRDIPAEQYARLQALAADVVEGIHQEASGLGWDSNAKKMQAVAVLQSVAKQHGITRFDEAVVGTVIEKVYADLKPTLPQPLQTAVAATVRSLEYNDTKVAA
jgi:hypothetical protein